MKKIQIGFVVLINQKFFFGGIDKVHGPHTAVGDGVKIFNTQVDADTAKDEVLNTWKELEVVPVFAEIDAEPKTLEETEKEQITKSLEKHKGKRNLVADELGISQRQLYRKIQEYQIQ